mmetsp:Transcript_98879/g.279362  ORF Transcript_98879/g.279362 Transcript_98879/m.279362 type:complete len:92 (-) Transcript_98879:92-367(-)
MRSRDPAKTIKDHAESRTSSHVSSRDLIQLAATGKRLRLKWRDMLGNADEFTIKKTSVANLRENFALSRLRALEQASRAAKMVYVHKDQAK